ncbi:hypothetical protein [Borreliella garinii]|uniref:hypothetical protein n=1 Tax=Borreliella garinii TaxID=29519 RepID=UPI001F31654E|nr:hypothetical protein [Borreliella garinii]
MKVYFYLFIIFFIMSCKLWYARLNDNIEKSDDYMTPESVGVKGILESVVEIKALSKNNLKDMAEKVKTTAITSKDKVLNSKIAGNDNDKKIPLKIAPALVSEIKNAAEKINIAVKSLIASGYAASEALKDNMKIGTDSICLLEKILEEVPKKNDSIDLDDNDRYGLCGRVNKVIEKFTKDKSNSVEFYILNSPKTNIEVVRECIKELMKKVENFFGNRGSKEGVSGELIQDCTKNNAEEFSEPLKSLSEAAAAIAEACKRLAYDIEEK